MLGGDRFGKRQGAGGAARFAQALSGLVHGTRPGRERKGRRVLAGMKRGPVQKSR